MNKFKVESAPTFWAKIYVCGELSIIKQLCREFCNKVGLCVNVKEADFIYTGSSQKGVEIELINYARFPAKKNDIFELAENLATEILKRAHQKSCTIMTPRTSYYIKRTDLTS